MDLWSWFSGTVRIRVITADPERFINEALSEQIDLYDIHYTNDLEVVGKVDRRNYKSLKSLAKRRGSDVVAEGRAGAYWKGKRLVRRPAFVCSLLLILFLVLFLPTRVYFIRVQGNRQLPDRLILEHAENCGIRFGAKRSLVRSEKMKNRLLESVPQLQWAGINTTGCTAVISVREKDTVLENEDSSGVSSIVAVCDGIVEQCTVIRGNSLCSVGDAVKEGQVLVSGYTDCGIFIRTTKAEAEIFAKTMRNLEVRCLTEGQKRTDDAEPSVRISIIIGKKQIYFHKDSGIYHSSCVKMREEVKLKLPGGFQLPITVVKERIVPFDTTQNDRDTFPFAEEFARAYLQKEMVSGSILSESVTAVAEDGVWVQSGVYNCYEMIGVQRNEEIIG